jgi:hypothetical protein
MIDEDDFMHYFNACSRLRTENEQLRSERDLWEQRTKTGAEIIEECVAKIERLKRDVSALLEAEIEIEELRAALRGMLDEWEKLSRYGSPMAKAANERVNAARRALCESHK